MEIKKLELSQLRVNPKNYRVHPEKQIDELVRSFELFGQIRPIVVDADCYILAGHGIYEALKKAGAEEVFVYQVDLDEKSKLKLMLADNKLYELGISDYDKVKSLMLEINETSIPGYDDEALRLIINQNNYGDDLIKSYGKMDEEKVREMQQEVCPCCGRKL